ncbi:MAG: flagellar basal body-associated FliL family protein [Azospirillaceae bacterium]
MTAETMNGAVDDVVDQLPRKKFSGKKLVLLVLLPLLIIGGGVGALVVTGVLGDLLGGGEPAAEEEQAAEAAGPGYFHDLPDMLVNLDSPSGRQTYLKISVSLELASEADLASVEAVMPRIVDNFQVYLRELRIEDLRGSAGLYRLREELLRRVSAAVPGASVRDVLFREMLVQ